MLETPYNKGFPDKKLTPFGHMGSDGVRIICRALYKTVKFTAKHLSSLL